MSAYYDRCHDAVLRLFRAFLLDWLANLGPEGWTGTAAELEVVWCSRAAVLPRHQRPIVPAPKGFSQRLRAEEATLAGAGWRVEFRRSATARTIHVIRAVPPAQI